MPITNFSLFISITFIVSASPGPVMLSCMANGGRFGISKAAIGMLGACCGNLLLVCLSALGLGLILSENDFLFTATKLGGAAYLAFLGIQIIRKPLTLGQLHTVQITSSSSLFLNAFLIAISNPKGIIYFGALFPQFISYQKSLALQFSVLTLTFLIVDLLWMFAYAVAGTSIMRWLKSPKHQLWFNIVSGSVLIIAAIFMAFSGKI